MSGPFERDAIADVADAVGVSESDLVEAAGAVQAAVGDYPGASVDGLVYEWRQAFADDPLVERTPTRWVLRVPERVWTDLCNRAGVRDSLRPALASLHAKEVADVEADGGGRGNKNDADDDRVPLVLARV